MSAVFPKISSFQVIFFRKAPEESNLSIVLDPEQSTIPDERAVKDIFEIHAPGVDTDALVQKLEERVRSRGYGVEELERIRNLSFTPVSPAGPGGFDPALTAELFEQPVPPPDFKSRKFRYLKGPLRWLAVRIYKLLAQVHARLTENKTRAFYNVVHELIAVNHRHEKLRANFDLVLLENLRLRAKLGEALDARETGLDENPELQSNLENASVIPDSGFEKAPAAFLDALPREPDGLICVLDDDGARAAFELRARGRNEIIMNAADAVRLRLARRSGDAEVFHGTADLFLAEQGDASLAAVIIPDLNRLSGAAPLLPALIRRKLAPGGHLLMRMSAAREEGAFVPMKNFTVNTAALLDEFVAGGFTIVAPNIQGAGEFAALLRGRTSGSDRRTETPVASEAESAS